MLFAFLSFEKNYLLFFFSTIHQTFKSRPLDLYNLFSSSSSPLLSLLKSLLAARFRLSKENDLPPVRIASNATLSDMATKRPTMMADLAHIRDLPDTKALKFGPTFVECVKKFCSENGLPVGSSNSGVLEDE